MLTEDAARRAGDGVFLAGITFHGKVTRETSPGTGASIVRTTSGRARELGLKPSAEAPTIPVRVAGGSIVAEALMTVPAVRVGRFTVRDVRCAVAPP